MKKSRETFTTIATQEGPLLLGIIILNLSLSLATADDAEVDLDESSFADLDAQAAAYNESHPEMQQAQIKPTHRLAVVNLDWDHVRASHLYKICSSVVSASTFPASDHIQGFEGQNSSKRRSNNQTRGNIVSVRVYPSKFGQERMAREEKEGPPPEIFKKKLLNTGEEITPQSVYEVGDGNDYDEDALRKYQLERLRYAGQLDITNLLYAQQYWQILLCNYHL
jgi:hypothetical protein